MQKFPLFTGNCPRNVAKDAKYVIRSDGRKSVVALTYRAPNEEKWLATTEDHPELVDMVNEVKRVCGQSRHGPFYINEYKQVIVPVGDDSEYFLAGEYHLDLVFEFEGKRLAGEAIDFSGQRLSPGDDWVGPHPGIPYVLSAGARDIYYESRVRKNVIKKVKLSDTLGKNEAAAFAQQLSLIKGWEGGRFYVNEWCEMFTPTLEDGIWRYKYLGRLSLDSWFPKPICS